MNRRIIERFSAANSIDAHVALRARGWTWSDAIAADVSEAIERLRERGL